MSPEQATGQRLDARSDIFSFGVVLYEALAGKRPFAGASAPDVLYAIVHSSPAPLPDQVPLRLRSMLEKALQKNPEDRFQTMRELVTELRDVARESAPAAAMRTDAAISARARLWVAALAALAVIVAAAAWLSSRRTSSVTPARRDYIQLTSFADSAMSPTLSPDGRMLAFIRGESEFGGGPAEIYVKLLPDGEP